MRSKSLTMLTFLLATVVGCASAPTEERDVGTADMTASEAVEKEAYDFKEALLERAPATAESLGIASWSVYSVGSSVDGFVGMVAFAEERGGEVKYAVTLNTTDQKFSIVKYAPEGKDAAAQIDEATWSLLQAELTALGGKLEEMQSARRGISTKEVWSNRKMCGISLAVAAFGIITLAPFAGLWIGILTGTAADMAISLVVGVGLGIPYGGAAAFIATRAIVDAVDSCTGKRVPGKDGI